MATHAIELQNKSNWKTHNSESPLYNEAERLLGSETLQNLIEWKRRVLSSESEYTVFMARRSYVLFLLMEKMTGEPFSDETESGEEQHFPTGKTSKTCLTDSGVMLQCEEIYDYYENNGKQFPRIDIVDDVLIHGRNINHFLRVLENRFLEIFEKRHQISETYSEEELCREQDAFRNAFAEAVTIRVFYCDNGPLLLSPRFLLCLVPYEYVDISELRQLSGLLSSLVLYTDVANATYVISEKITDAQMQAIDEKARKAASQKDSWAYVSSRYQGNRQNLLIRYFHGNHGKISAIGIVRFQYHYQNNSYRAIPLVIIPRLDASETGLLSQMLAGGYRLNEDIRRRFERRVSKLQSVSGLRLMNEFLTLIMSNIMLKEFNRKFEVKQDRDDFNREVKKLSRNYYEGSLDRSQKALAQFLQDNLLTEKDLEEIVYLVTAGNREFIEITGNGPEPDKKEKDSIRIEIEDRFYQLGCEDEREAIKLEKKIVLDLRGIFKRKNQDCFTILKSFFGNKNVPSRNYQLALFLQMMDAGILSLSSFASDDANVHGLQQLVKAGEQAMFLLPIRMYLYVPMLNMMEQVAGYRQTAFANELERFFDSTDCRIEEKEKEKIRKYVRDIHDLGQNMSEWDGNFYGKLELPDEERNIMDVGEYFKAQLQYMNQYKKFCYGE